MSEPLTIVHVVGNSVIGGAERHVREIAGAMRDRGHHVDVVCPRPGPLTEALEREGIAFTCREFVVPLPNDEYGLEPDAVSWLAEYLRVRGVDVVHSHLYPAHLHASLAAHDAGIRAIVHTAHTLVARPGDAVLTRVTGAVTIATARAVAARLSESGVPEEHLRVIYNGIGREHALLPGEAGVRLREELALTGRVVLLAVSRLSPEKGLDVLLRSMPKVLSARPEAVLLIAGAGPERKRLERLVADLGVGTAVRFLGSRDDTAALYRACDVFVLPSSEEACSLALLEAMAAAAPIVATAVGGTPEVARDGLDASLVPPREADVLAAAIVHLLDDPKRRLALGASARRRVLLRFSLDAAVDATLTLYRELLARATRASSRR